jgi:hypothetical protein
MSANHVKHHAEPDLSVFKIQKPDDALRDEIVIEIYLLNEKIQ